jgi:hypothetical protein
MAVTSAANDFVSSIVELVKSFFHTIYTLISTAINAVISLITGFFSLIVDTISGLLSITAESGKFLVSKYTNSFQISDVPVLTKQLGNAVLLAIIGFGVLVWLKYMGSQGKPVVVGNKKLN